MAHVVKLVLLAAVILFAVAIVRVIVLALKDSGHGRGSSISDTGGNGTKRTKSDCGSGCQWVCSVARIGIGNGFALPFRTRG